MDLISHYLAWSVFSTCNDTKGLNTNDFLLYKNNLTFDNQIASYEKVVLIRFNIHYFW